MHLPILTADYVKLCAYTVLVVKGATLDMPCAHEVEGGVGWLEWVIYLHVIATNSHLIGHGKVPLCRTSRIFIH